MKLNTTDFRRKCQHPLLLATGALPLAMLLTLAFAPALLPRIWLIPAAFVLLAWGCILLPGRRRLLGGAIGAAGLFALALLLFSAAQPLMLLLPLMYAALLFVALPIGGWERNHELAVAWHVSGVLTHVVLQVMINIGRRTGVETYQPAALPLVLSFLTYALLVLMALNRASLDSAAMSRRTVPLLMKRQNIVVTTAMLVLGVLIAAIPAIGSLLERAWNLLMRVIAYLAGLLMALLPQTSGGRGGGAAPEEAAFGLGAASEPSMLAVILEKVMLVVALVVLAAAVFFAGRVLVKKLIQLVKYLFARLSQYSAAAGEDYEDEITDTRDEPGVEREGLLSRLRRSGMRDESGLSPDERVRQRYRRLKRKHADWTQASTARETLPEAAAALYEQARYSERPLTNADAERFRENTRRI